jgi:predicted RNA-binding Zn ribbon-like protein
MPTLPAWYPWPDTENKPAPMPLLLVQAFVNTLDVEKDIDVLEKQWFIEAGLLDADATATGPDLELARRLRESIRGVLRSDNADLAPLREVAEAHRARLTVLAGGQIALEQAGQRALGDALFGVLLIIRAAQENGTWRRLRVCANDECQWAFYDRSRNQQGHWCDMATCGNRLKNRDLRARRRG